MSQTASRTIAMFLGSFIVVLLMANLLLPRTGGTLALGEAAGVCRQGFARLLEATPPGGGPGRTGPRLPRPGQGLNPQGGLARRTPDGIAGRKRQNYVGVARRTLHAVCHLTPSVGRKGRHAPATVIVQYCIAACRSAKTCLEGDRPTASYSLPRVPTGSQIPAILVRGNTSVFRRGGTIAFQQWQERHRSDRRACWSPVARACPPV